MLITLLATLMFIAMLAATFNALRSEMAEARVQVETDPRRNRR